MLLQSFGTVAGPGGLASHPRKQQLKLLLGRLLLPHSLRRWQDYVARSEVLSEAADRDLRVLTKIFRPYFIQQFRCNQRVQALIEHYEINQALGLEPLMRRLLQGPVLLHRGASKGGGSFELVLSALRRGHREGEYCLTLKRGGHDLYDMNFQFAGQPGKTRLVLSRFQSTVKHDDARETFRHLTRDMHGTRPVNLMLHAARNLAWIWNCQAVVLLADRQRVVLNPWRRAKVKSSYDSVWLELGARQVTGGFFELEPMGEKKIDLSRIASKKRAEAVRREELLNRLTADLRAAFARGSGWAAPAAVPAASPLAC